MLKHILTIVLFAISFSAIPTSANAAMRVELVENEQQPQISIVDGQVHVTGASGQVLYIYNIAGVCIHTIKIDSQDRTFDLNLAKGCYIMKVGKTVRKVSIM